MRPDSIASELRRAKLKLRAAGIASAQLDARLIVQHATRLSHEQLIAAEEEGMSARERLLIEELVRRRLADEPVSRIMGEREFYGRKFHISRETLDPRPETETLVEVALRIARGRASESGGLRIADLGTGSGAIIVTLLAELPPARGVGSDISLKALNVARENALRHEVAHRLELVQGSWFEGLAGAFDLIVSNPPYIARAAIKELPPEVRLYDPSEALDGGSDGLDAYRHIAKDARRHLKSGGHLCLEIGLGQESAVTEIALDCGLEPSCKVPPQTPDLSGILRVLAFENI